MPNRDANIASKKNGVMTKKLKYGHDHFQKIGRLGGLKSKKGFFGTRPDLASEMGARGGKLGKIGKTYLGRQGNYRVYLDKTTHKEVLYPIGDDTKDM